MITDAKARDPQARARSIDLTDSACDYDAERYAELLLRAMATILQPAGLDQEQIAQRFTQIQTQPLTWQIPLEWFASVNRRDFANVG